MAELIGPLTAKVEELAEHFSSSSSPIGEDSPLLHDICALIETCLRHDIKKGFFGRKEPYDAMEVCLKGEAATEAVAKLSTVKSSVGRGRAFIRWSLTKGSLAESLQVMSIHPSLKEFYGDQAILRSQQLLNPFLDLLYRLSDIKFNLLNVKGLDDQWPNASDYSASDTPQPSPPVSRRRSIDDNVSQTESSRKSDDVVSNSDSANIAAPSRPSPKVHSDPTSVTPPNGVDHLQAVLMVQAQTIKTLQVELLAAEEAGKSVDILRNQLEQQRSVSQQLQRRQHNIINKIVKHLRYRLSAEVDADLTMPIDDEEDDDDASLVVNQHNELQEIFAQIDDLRFSERALKLQTEQLSFMLQMKSTDAPSPTPQQPQQPIQPQEEQEEVGAVYHGETTLASALPSEFVDTHVPELKLLDTSKTNDLVCSASNADKIQELTASLQLANDQQAELSNLVNQRQRDLDTTQKRVADLEQRLADARAANTAHLAKVERVSQEKTMLLSQLDQAKEQAAQLTAALENTKSLLLESTNQLTTAKSQINDTNERLRQSTAQLEMKTTALTIMSEEKDQLMSSSQQLQASVNVLQQEHDEMSIRLLAAYDEVTRLAAVANTAVEGADDTIVLLKSENSDLRTQIQSIQAQKAQVEVLLSSVSNDITSLKQAKQEESLSRQQREERQIAASRQQADQIKQLTQQYEQASLTIKGLEQQIQQLRRELEQHKIWKNDDTATIERLSGERGVKDPALLACRQRLFEVEAMLEEAKSDVAILTNELVEKTKSKDEIFQRAEQLHQASIQSKYAAWMSDSQASSCTKCRAEFSLLNRKHHCRSCGKIYCGSCSHHFISLPHTKKPARVCDGCFDVRHK